MTPSHSDANEINLTGLWRFQPDAFNEGERLGYQQASFDVRLWREVSVPCSFDECIPQLAAYEGAGWYRRVINVSPVWAGSNCLLRFEGVNYNATIWVNGIEAGSHESGFLRFEIPVGNALRAGDNTIAVRVDNTRRHGQAPGMERGWRPYGGILREVSLIRRPPVHLGHPVIVAQADGSYHARISLSNENANSIPGSVAFSIIDEAGQVLARSEADERYLTGGSEAGFDFTGALSDVIPWSPQHPTLYTAQFQAGTEQMNVSFGFRTISRDGAQLMLNGQPLILHGFNRHEDSAAKGMVTDLATAESDLRQMKLLGSNFVRLCHYPHHPGELELCDKLGLLVMAEIPLYWWNGDLDGEQPATVKLGAAKRQLSEMIHRDVNHPSIIFWSVSNETDESRPEVVAGNSALIEYARRLDPTRLAVHVSSHWMHGPHFEQDDVLCLNAYPSWSGRGWKSNPLYDVNESTRWWDEALVTLSRSFPERPILITEFGYPALYRVYANGAGEDMQAAALLAEARAFNKPYVCGMTVWCYADHPWPEERWFNGLTNSPFGVVTRDRRRKKAFDAVRTIFGAPASVSDGEQPIENWPVTMLRLNLGDIPVAPFPDGYGVRPLRRNEGGLWEDIWRDAEPFFKIENGLFEREFGDDPVAIERRCFIITAPDGAAAATISAWYSRDINGLDYGRIHWVATRKAYQGKGIMKAGMSYALQQMSQWHERAILDTSTGRVAAIKLYLDFGFLPDLTPPRAREVWTAFRRRLNHPALSILDRD